jgi:hypothetical protein
MLIDSRAITTALNAVVTDAVPPKGNLALTYGTPFPIDAATVEFIFAYGSGGTTAKVWLQTSFDAGVTWVDIANLAATTASAKRIFNLSGLSGSLFAPDVNGDLMPAAFSSIPTDGTLADNTCRDGAIGELYRVKITTTGTYAATTLSTYVSFR